MAWERWRRVPEPNACDFCLTLASRGAVYHTKITAAGKRYHRMCRCTAAVEGKFSARKDTAIPEEDANRIVKMQVTKKGKTYVYVYDLSKFPRLKPPPKVKTPAPVSNGVKAATPQPVTTGSFADRIAALRAKYRRDTKQSEWTTATPSVRRPYELELADLKEKRKAVLAKLDELKKADLDPEVRAGGMNYWKMELDGVDDRIAEVKRALENAGGSVSDVAVGNLDTVLEAGDEVLKRVEDIVGRSSLAAKKADVAAAKELAEEARDAARHGFDETLERDLNERLLGQRVTFADVWNNSEYRQVMEARGLSFSQWEIEARRVRSVQVAQSNVKQQMWHDAVAQLHEAEGVYRQAQRDAWREAITEVMGDARQLGGKGTTFTNPKTGKPLTSRSELGRLLDDASQVYPTEWLEAQARRFPSLDAGTNKRGYFSAGRGEIRISGYSSMATKADPKGMFPTAVHELGHSMEYSLPDISRLEWVWLRRRAGFETGSPSGRTRIYKGEYGYEDDFTSHYTGRTYERLSTDLETPEAAYEVFTTGVEALFGGEIDDYMMRKNKTGFDRDFARFILGVMVIV